MMLDVFLSWSDVNAGHSDLGSDISTEEYLKEDRPTTSMKKGWLYRTSRDDKNHPMKIQC